VTRRLAVDLVVLALLLLVSLLILMPFAWLLSASLRLPRESFTLPPKWLPTDLRWQNYREVFDLVPMADYVVNSLRVTVAIVAGQVATAATAAYAFARLRFPGREALFVLLMSGLMVPLFVTIIPVFVLVKTVGLNDTHGALIVPALVTPFGVFLLRQFFLTIPRELEEAATIDGAGPWQVFWRIIVPLGRPGIVVLAILAFNSYWNEFFRPLIFLNSAERYTLPIGLVSLRGYMGTNSVAVVLAGVTLAMLPVVIVFLVAQRRLVEGIALTGLKG
jgi:multiple sugar transport system permease protein